MEKSIKRSGIKLNFYNQFNDYILDCDFIIIDNKFFTPFWQNESEKIEEKILNYHKKTKIFFGLILLIVQVGIILNR